MLEFAFPQRPRGYADIVIDGNVHPTNDLGDTGESYESNWSMNHPSYPLRLLISTANHDFTSGTMPPGEVVTAQPLINPSTFVFTATARVPVGGGTTKDDTSLYLWYDDLEHFGVDWFISVYNVQASDKPKLRAGKYTKRGYFT